MNITNDLQTEDTRTHSTGFLIRRAIRSLLNHTVMILLAIFFMFPIVFMLVSSIKTDEDQITSDVAGIEAFVPYPVEFQPIVEDLDRQPVEVREEHAGLGLQNFHDVFQRMDFGRFMFNSIFISGVTVMLGLLVNSMAAYALSRLRWKGRALVLAIVVALIIIPFEAVAVPLMLFTTKLPWIDGTIGWHNTYHIQIIPFVADAMSIFLFYQFFIGLPKDLEEAAMVDGASRFRMYFQIIVPLSRPVFATVAILKFLQYWGSYLWPLMVVQIPEVRPLTVAMTEFFGQYPRLWGDTLAFTSMITIPVLLVFMLFQKWFVQSVASTGVKG
jgi:multiple sugar transport system permease protein